MAWFLPFRSFWASKPSTANANGQTEPPAVETDAKNARKSVSSTINKGAISAKDNTEAIGQNLQAAVEDTSNAVEQQAAVAKNTVTAPVDTKVEKMKHYKRPGISSHDSVGDKFKHAFKLDHKQHHPQKDASPPATDV